MTRRMHAALPLLLALPLVAQDTSWLHLVARLDLRTARVAAADISADGTTVVAVDDQRTITVYNVDPWRRLRGFAVAGKADVDDVRITGDGTQVVVLMASWEPVRQLVYRLADGAPVEGDAPSLADIDATPPPELEQSCPERPTHLRAALDHRTAVFRTPGRLGVWRAGTVRWLGNSPAVDDFAVSGDGNHVVVARPTGVEVLAVAGGDPWRLPLGFAPDVAVATIGKRGGFVCVDREFVVVGDAVLRREVLRVPVSKLGLQWDHVQFVAAADDGLQLAVTAWSSASNEPASWRIDLGSGAVQVLPTARKALFWGDDGWLLLDGAPGVCGVVLEPKWIWMPRQGERAAWRPDMWHANGVLVPGRKELVYLAVDLQAKEPHGELRRCSAGDGAVLARRAMAEPWIEGLAFVSGHLVVGSHGDTDVVELRDVEDFAVEATAQAPRTSYGRATFRTAAHAPRIAFQVGDELEVYEVKLPQRTAR